MNVFGKSFSFNNKKLSDEYVICSFSDISSRYDTAINYNINRGDISPSKEKPGFYSKSFSDVLSFEVSIMRKDEVFFSRAEREKLIMWIDSPLTHRLFTLEDYAGDDYHKDIEYFAICKQYIEHRLGNHTFGITFSFECDSPHGYTPELSLSFISGVPIEIENTSLDTEKDYYPTLMLRANSNTEVTIKNNHYPDEPMLLKMLAAQQLIVDCAYRDILDDMDMFSYETDTNLRWLHLKQGKNIITVTGDVLGEIKCRFARKGGI